VPKWNGQKKAWLPPGLFSYVWQAQDLKPKSVFLVSFGSERTERRDLRMCAEAYCLFVARQLQRLC
jgi:hypothetical protein